MQLFLKMVITSLISFIKNCIIVFVEFIFNLFKFKISFHINFDYQIMLNITNNSI